MRALITQREETDRYGGRIDVLEEGYVRFFQDIGADVYPVSNYRSQIKSLWDRDSWDFLILTGGGSVPCSFYDSEIESPQQIYRDRVEKELVYECISRKIPILGICRGMQFLNGLYGGKVSRLAKLPVDRAIGMEHPIKLWDGRMIMVNHYHNDGILMENLAPCFLPWAIDEENSVIEGFYSNEMNLCAMQWHPERKFGSEISKTISMDMIASFVKGLERDFFSIRKGGGAL